MGKNTAKLVKFVTIIAVVSIVTITVAGCSALIYFHFVGNRPMIQDAYPYNKSDYYTTLWTNRGSVIEKPFCETTSDRGNPLYVGVIRNASRQSTDTISYEYVNSSSKAASVFQVIVTAAKNDGYKERPANSADPSADPRAVGYWLGTNNLTFSSKAIQYYYGDFYSTYVVEQNDFVYK